MPTHPLTHAHKHIHMHCVSIRVLLTRTNPQSLVQTSCRNTCRQSRNGRRHCFRLQCTADNTNTNTTHITSTGNTSTTIQHRPLTHSLEKKKHKKRNSMSQFRSTALLSGPGCARQEQMTAIHDGRQSRAPWRPTGAGRRPG